MKKILKNLGNYTSLACEAHKILMQDLVIVKDKQKNKQ